MTATTTYAALGAISEGTHCPISLIASYTAELHRLTRHDRPQRLAALLGRAARFLNTEADGSEEEEQEGSDLLDALTETLQDYAPPCCYFGTLDGDGACFGFWPDWHALDDFDGLRCADLADIPEDYSGLALVVNDHGNASLYEVDPVAQRERLLWAVV